MNLSEFPVHDGVNAEVKSQRRENGLFFARLCLLIFLPLLSGGCKKEAPKAKSTGEAAQRREDPMSVIENFRSEARFEPMQAVERFASSEASEQFSEVTAVLWSDVVPREGWMNFFSSSGYAVVAENDERFLAAFQHPWADVLLITLWEAQEDGTWKIADLELLLGDFVRRKGAPPYEMTPAWTMMEVEPPQAVAMVAQVTLSTFAHTFAGSKDGKMPNLRYWRSFYPNAQNREALGANRAGAQVALERNILGLLDFLHHRTVPAAVEAVRVQLSRGEWAEALRLAPGTSDETAELLRRHLAGQMDRLHLACWGRGSGSDSFVFFETNPPDTFVSFKVIVHPDGQPAIDRIELVNHPAYRRFLEANPANNNIPK